MAESGKSDRWNSLLETLGVAPSEVKPVEPAGESEAFAAPAATPIEQPRAVSMLRPERPKPAPKAKPAGKPPAKSASYWSRIAGALGLESGTSEEIAAEEIAAQETQPDVEIEPTVAEVRQPKPRDEMAERERQEDVPEPPREEFSRRGGRREQSSREAGGREQGSREQGSRERGVREREARERDTRERDTREPREREFERGRQERGGRRGSTGREPFGEERRPAAEEVAEQRPTRGGGFGSGLDFEPAGHRDEDESPRLREPTLPRQREVDESGSVLDYEARAGEGSDGSDLSIEQLSERRPGGEEEGDEGGSRRRRRRRRGRGKRAGSEAHVAGAADRHDEDSDPAGEELDFDFERDDDLDADSDIGPKVESRDRPGRSTRRSEGEERPAFGSRSREREGERGTERDGERGGRTRRREERPARGSSRQPGGYQGEPAPRPEPSGRPARAAVSKPENEELDSDFDIGDEHEEHEGGNLPTHKKIPTWEDAVSVLINANMASRSNSDRDRGRGRGRGRR